MIISDLFPLFYNAGYLRFLRGSMKIIVEPHYLTQEEGRIAIPGGDLQIPQDTSAEVTFVQIF